jgi:hypothetical protein
VKRFGVPPLLGAELRVRRARQLIGTLKRQEQAWANAHQDLVTGAPGSGPGTVILDVTKGDPHRMGRMSITIGEAVYNLRAALDYIVYDLACMAARKHVAGTQFPIEESSAGFRSRVSGKNAKGEDVGHFLRSVPPGAIALIAKLQPYAGCTWTRDLRELSNPDKHRRLASLRSKAIITVKSWKVVAVDPDTEKGTVEVRYDAEVEVSLEDGRPVRETLQTLCGEVEATVAVFKSHIKSSELGSSLQGPQTPETD